MSDLVKKLIKEARDRYPEGGASYRGFLSQEDMEDISKTCRIASNEVHMNGEGRYNIYYTGNNYEKK